MSDLPRVIGLDLSIASTGLADTLTGRIETCTIATRTGDYGTGHHGTPDMRVALLQRAGVDQRDDNQVDAHWLAAAQRQALEAADWPASLPSRSSTG